MSIRKQDRRTSALARYPKNFVAKLGLSPDKPRGRTEEQWKAERARLEELVTRG